MVRIGSMLAVIALLVVSCSGVTQEDLDAALADVGTLESQVADLQTRLESAESKASDAEGRVSELEKALSDAEADLVASREMFETITDLSETPNFPAAVLAGVLGRGVLRCGVSGSFVGFSEAEGDTMVGFDADFCRAVAAAVLGDAEAVEFVALSGGERWRAVRSGLVDVMFRTSTHTMTRDGVLGEQVDFGPTIFYDGTQFMGSSSRWGSGSTGLDLDGTTVCLPSDPIRISAITSYAADQGSEVVIMEVDSLENAITDSQCDLVSADGTLLAHLRETAARAGEAGTENLVIFPAVPITREPLAVAYSEGDTIWADIVDWVIYTTILADVKGLTSENIDAVEWDAESRRLLGADGDYPLSLGLEPDALYRVVKQVGSYGEIFGRHLGPVGYVQEGGLNQPSTLGGLLYAPPVR